MVKKYTKESEIGKQYGQLKIIDFTENKVINKKRIKASAVVICLACNSESYEIAHHSISCKINPINSCGCLNKGNKKHGLKNHMYYDVCKSVIRKCKSDYKNHQYYFDVGIKCFWTAENIDDFIKYLENNLPPRQNKETLSRIDKTRDYEPDNLKWKEKIEKPSRPEPKEQSILFEKQYTKESEIGKQYGQLKIIDFTEHHIINNKKIKAKAIVVCLGCNSYPFEIFHSYMIRKHNPVYSCGCLNLKYTMHGLKHHPYYNSCCGAIGRCKENYFSHEYYFDRGIKCDWTMKTITDFIKYLEDNLPPRKGNESLDRIDNDRGYQPGNLRWATKREQTLNRRSKISNHQHDQLKKEFYELQKENDLLRKEIDRFHNKITVFCL